MRMKTGAVLLWALATAYGLNTSLNCTRIAPYQALLKRMKRCNVTVENGFVHALCTLTVALKLQQDFIPAHPETLTMEQLLVSDEPVYTNTPEGGAVCMSLHSIMVRKWDYFPLKIDQPYEQFPTPEDSKLGPFRIFSLLVYIQRMTFNTTFRKPPQAAAAVCHRSQAHRSCNFDVYGFIECHRYNSTSLLKVVDAFFEFWNIGSATIQAVNITFIDTVKRIPENLFKYVSIDSIKSIIFYKCNFDSIGERDIPQLRLIDFERLDFFHAPIQEVHPLAFRANPGIKHVSFVGTKLPGIPEAICFLKHLETLDMSDTRVPSDTEFQCSPGNCQHNSTVQRLIMSGTNLSSLLNRAFCRYPRLKTVELDNCHIMRLSGSPFECLEKLNTLSMSGNKIRSLAGENMLGLTRLISLDLSKNRIVDFEGSQTFSTLKTLTRLILSHNEIKELRIGAVEYVPLEDPNLAYNQISKWKPPIFSRMGKLRTLLLEHNVLSGISDNMLSDISHVSYVNLSWNPWDCSSCQLKNIRSLLEEHPPLCTNCFLCKQPEQYEGRFVLEAPSNEDDCGPPDHFRIYGIPALLSILVASMVSYAVYRNRWYCMYGLLYLKVAIKAHRRHTHVGRFLWDGFLSYHASDAEWVREVLLPKLESGPMKFQFCVAERDFIPGLPITENICRAISQSRVSLFVLSREFCRSRWCMFELSLAQHRLFENDRQDGMVFIKKNDVVESDMSSMLAYLIKSRTYVQLPPDGSSEALNNLFWLQVLAALQQ